MTNPGPDPEGALSGLGGIEAWGQKTGDEYKAEMYGSIEQSADPITQFALGIPILGDIVEALTGMEDGDYTDLGSFASLLLGRDVSLASRVAAIENKIAVGAEYFDNFKRGDNETALGSPEPGVVGNWVQFGDGEPMGIQDQAAQVRRNALPDDGTRYARCPFLATSDDYRVAAVVHPRGTPPNPRTSLYGRCNPDMTSGIYVDFFGDRTAIGRFTRSGLTMNRSQWKSTTKRYSNSSTPELRMIGTRYQVVIDDVTILDHEDTSGYPVDNFRRTSGFSLSVWTGILAVPQFSPGFASFSVRNNDITAVQLAQSKAEAAQTAADSVTGIANNANTKADQAQAAADAVLGVAENADAKAQLALDNVQAALDGAQQLGTAFMPASGGVVLGRNEVNIGPDLRYPPSRDWRLTTVAYGLEANTGGSITVQLLAVSPARAATVVHTATIASGVVEYEETGLNVPIPNGTRWACNVTTVNGTASVLVCTINGALL